MLLLSGWALCLLGWIHLGRSRGLPSPSPHPHLLSGDVSLQVPPIICYWFGISLQLSHATWLPFQTLTSQENLRLPQIAFTFTIRAKWCYDLYTCITAAAKMPEFQVAGCHNQQQQMFLCETFNLTDNYSPQPKISVSQVKQIWLRAVRIGFSVMATCQEEISLC